MEDAIEGQLSPGHGVSYLRRGEQSQVGFYNVHSHWMTRLKLARQKGKECQTMWGKEDAGCLQAGRAGRQAWGWWLKSEPRSMALLEEFGLSQATDGQALRSSVYL